MGFQVVLPCCSMGQSPGEFGWIQVDRIVPSTHRNGNSNKVSSHCPKLRLDLIPTHTVWAMTFKEYLRKNVK